MNQNILAKKPYKSSPTLRATNSRTLWTAKASKTEAIAGSVLWKKVFLKKFSKITGMNMC